MSQDGFLKLLFGCLTLAFFVGAVCMPDRSEMLSGFWRICSRPGKIMTNYFELGGYSATFFNMAVVALIFWLLFLLLKAPANQVSTLAFLLTLGFGAWGITAINVWPTVLGVALYCLVTKGKLADHVNAMMFSTGIAPLITDLLVRYPHSEVVGFQIPGVLLALGVGLFIGFLLPAGLAHAPNIHKGFDLYSAAVPVCFLAFFLNATLYKTMGLELPAATPDLTIASRTTVNIFCGALFGVCILAALAMGCRFRDYWALITAPEHTANVGAKFGNPVLLMNLGVYGLFILGYYNLIGAEFHGVTFGVIFCMVCTCNSGSHPGNVWPIMLGYWLMSLLAGWLSGLTGGTFTLPINAAAIVVGLCFANGLSPIVSKYGWFWGVVAAAMHYLLVTSVPNMHGGYCLYNGGFTAAVICILLVPVLERHGKPRTARTGKIPEKS